MTATKIVDGEVVLLSPLEIAEIEAAAPAPEHILSQVYAERERRLALGFDYDFGDARGVHHIGTTPADMVGWDEVSKLAGAALALGLTASAVTIVTDTGPVEVTAMEWQQILVAAGAFRQPIWQRSFVLAAMVAAATSPDDLRAINPTEGWPE